MNKEVATKPVAIKPPRRMEIGGWNELTYTAMKTYRGLKWYKTCFGEKGEREDWVADLPGVTVNVSRYTRNKKWEIVFKDPTSSWEKAADAALERARDTVKHDLNKAIIRLAALATSSNLIEFSATKAQRDTLSDLFSKPE